MLCFQTIDYKDIYPMGLWWYCLSLILKCVVHLISIQFAYPINLFFGRWTEIPWVLMMLVIALCFSVFIRFFLRYLILFLRSYGFYSDLHSFSYLLYCFNTENLKGEKKTTEEEDGKAIALTCITFPLRTFFQFVLYVDFHISSYFHLLLIFFFFHEQRQLPQSIHKAFSHILCRCFALNLHCKTHEVHFLSFWMINLWTNKMGLT